MLFLHLVALFLGGCATAPKPLPTTSSNEPVLVTVKETRATPTIELLFPDTDFRVALVSDLNGRYGSTTYGDDVHAALARILEMRPSLVVSVGDMVAGQKAGLDYPLMWEAFHSTFSDPLKEAGIPFAIIPGNHDASAFPEFAEEREHYAAAWEERMPQVDWVDSAHYPFYYAFEHKGVLMLALDATVPGPLDAEQRGWLRGVLSNAPVSQPKLMFSHLPLVSFTERKRTDTVRDPELEQMIRDYGVEIFVSGHHHSYYEARVDGIRMLSVGCLGGGPQPLYGQEERSPKTLLVLERAPNGELRTEALVGASFNRLMAAESLPSWLPGSQRLVLRYGRESLPNDTALAMSQAAFSLPRAWLASNALEEQQADTDTLAQVDPSEERDEASTIDVETALPRLRVLLRGLDSTMSFRPTPQD
ncbi:MAG: metallophosphoesterase [Myxococcota bacterium]|jgi:3',5'-cyclic AMP phosphodiesterase CpdA|nr:metallophosphoesterase [Myxococcota bacterium]